MQQRTFVRLNFLACKINLPSPHFFPPVFLYRLCQHEQMEKRILFFFLFFSFFPKKHCTTQIASATRTITLQLKLPSPEKNPADSFLFLPSELLLHACTLYTCSWALVRSRVLKILLAVRRAEYRLSFSNSLGVVFCVCLCCCCCCAWCS